MCEISIIVPVYKVEKYLKKCVDSILAQTFSDFELILVDDGSPDNSGRICDDYAKKDARVRVVHKQNGGLSSARNAGIEVAKGKYLGFVDSDDYIAEDMYELLYKAIIKEEADLSICGIYDVYEGKDPIIKPTIKKTVTAEEALLLILQGNIISVHAVNKLYKRELFSTIRYPEGKYHEDSFIIVDLLNQCHKVAIDSEQKYYYYHRLGSINTESFSEKQFEFIEACVKSKIPEYFAFANVIPKCGLLDMSFKTNSILSDKQLGQTKYIPSTSDLEKVLSQYGHLSPMILITCPQFGQI